VGAEHGAQLAPEAIDELRGRVGRVLSGRDPGPGGAPGGLAGGGLRVAVACSRFNGAITWGLLEGALDALDDCDIDRSDVTVAWAPGAFELPLLARTLADRGADAVVCLGAVVRGETDHYAFVAGECARGIQQVQLESGAPVTFGVLTTDTEEQALARSGRGEANKGREAAYAAVEMARLLRAT
jgi:6,7-dimethyl-8-ribityllumazine synthase